MKKTLKVVALLLLFGIIGIAAYFYLNPKKGLKIILPELNQIQNIHVRLSQDTAFIDLDLKIANKSFFKLHIDSLMYHVRLDTSTLLSKNEYLDLELKPSQQDTLHLPLALPYKRLMKKIKSLQGQDSVDIPIDVRAVYATIFGKAVLPYSKTLRIEVPHPPKFEVEKIEYLKRHKKTGFFLAHVKIQNYGKIDVNISDIKYRLVVKELFTAEGSEKKNIHIKPKSTLEVKLPIQVEFKSLLKTVGRYIRDDDRVDYRLKVTAQIQNDKISLQKTPIEIEKSGVMELRKRK